MHPGKSSKIFSKIASVSPDLISDYFGEIGKKILSMFENFGNHPEMDSVFFEDCDLSICDLIDLASYAEKRKMIFKDHFKQIAFSHMSEKFKKSKMPLGSGAYARLLRRPIKEEARLTRKIQFVRSKQFNKSFHSLWDCVPSNFSTFFKDSVELKFCDLDEPYQIFSKNSCTNLANKSLNLIERFYRPTNFLGYKKINIVDACMILAKVNDFRLEGEFVVREGRNYSAMVVPIHLVSFLDDHVKRCIEEADNCKQLIFDSAFDNYLLIAPESDLDNIRRSNFNMAVLGERNGESYFICDWRKLV